MPEFSPGHSILTANEMEVNALVRNDATRNLAPHYYRSCIDIMGLSCEWTNTADPHSPHGREGGTMPLEEQDSKRY